MWFFIIRNNYILDHAHGNKHANLRVDVNMHIEEISIKIQYLLEN